MLAAEAAIVDATLSPVPQGVIGPARYTGVCCYATRPLDRRIKIATRDE
jgi:hypothetical protein